MQSQPLSVNELNTQVKQLLEGGLGHVWVQGELSNIAMPPSGHLYFTLKDSKAQVRCAMFKGFMQGNPIRPQQGMQVEVRARVSLYAPRGDYQLIVERMQEAGLGDLQRAYEALKARLEAEGLFASEHKKPIPAMPQCVGVVTSPTGAAIHDILHVIERRYPALRVIVYPTLVQGNDAAPQIARMIEIACRHNQADVLIVGRGGGSLEDLWPFNEEVVARAIYKSSIPIISAVGHEVDVSISDFVADMRAPTPTAAAECITPDGVQLLNEVNALEKRLKREMLALIEGYLQELNHLLKRLSHPGDTLDAVAQQLDELWMRMSRAIKLRINQSEQQFLSLTRALEALSPLAILNRGYSITFDEKGEALRSVAKIHPGSVLLTRLADGEVKSRLI